ncbi:MAG: DNA gyrase subunit A [Oscillospiraceae bacterium]|nr:DNA gyrase subunit A [Candidatus Limimonas coprohippi]MCQ2488388.1 DNA gyrase subunit A [Clostridia bacterium]
MQKQKEQAFRDGLANARVIKADLDNEMRNSFLTYSMSVIIERALPDVRDGLKPVHRRIVYTMHENGLTPDKPYRKCADTVGSVLGRYHPHGDASVYDAMVRLAQDFSMRYTLVDGHGNFGSIDGDPPAAYRYTESRMSKLSVKMMADIDKNTVDFIPNYDDRLKEPTVLPVRFPNLLVNGSMGIAVGMATNIPPHNLREVIDGMCALIDNPDIEVAELMDHIPGPDFPTSGIIMGRSGIRAAYATGRGKIVVRARTEIVEKANGRYEIKVTEIPYGVNKSRLIESIADLVKEKRVEGIADVNDYSSMSGMYISIDIKRDANPNVILNQLFQYTQLQTSFGVINLCIVDGQPKILTLKEYLTEFINFQKDIVTRRTKFELNKAKERAHILEGLAKAIDIVDEIIDTIRHCKGGQAEAKVAIMEKFGFDDPQASAIVAFRLGQLAGLEIQKIMDELDNIHTRIAEYEEILADETKLMSIIKEESQAIADKFGDERRTEICNVSGEVDIEDLIPEETCVFTLTEMGYIKRMPTTEYSVQHRGGRGISGMTQKEDDVTSTMFTCSTHDYVMFFTNLGRTYRIKGYEVPEASRQAKGTNIVNVLPLMPGERVTSMLQVPEVEGEEYICMMTKKGIIKRTPLVSYKNVRKSGLIAINLDEDDELSWVRLTSGDDDLLVATHEGMSIRFHESDARELGRTARGVKSISFKKNDDYVVGFDVIKENATVLTVSETGFGRRSSPDDYKVQKRGGSGLLNYRVDKFGKVAAIRMVEPEDDLIMISANGVIIRIESEEINCVTRPAKGVKVMRIKEDADKVITLAVIREEWEKQEIVTDSKENEDGTVEPVAAEATEEVSEETEE